jgi:hypothetical protein
VEQFHHRVQIGLELVVEVRVDLVLIIQTIIMAAPVDLDRQTFMHMVHQIHKLMLVVVVVVVEHQVLQVQEDLVVVVVDMDLVLFHPQLMEYIRQVVVEVVPDKILVDHLQQVEEATVVLES